LENRGINTLYYLRLTTEVKCFIAGSISIDRDNHKRKDCLTNNSENHGINDLQHETMQYHMQVVDYCTAL
jgi:hypothetical protein